MPIRRLPHVSAVVLFVALFVACGAASALRLSATFDETTHLPAGFTYLDRLDFRHNPEHPPLAKMWAALPLWISGRGSADYDSPNWLGAHVPPGDPRRSRADQWKFGYEFLNGRIGDPVRKDPRRVLMPGRMAMLAAGVLLLLVVYALARDLWGRDGALVALALGALSPTTLAHAGLVTTDLPAALGFAATAWCFLRFTRRPGWRPAVATGASLGAALLTKYTAMLLAPILVLMAAVWIVAGVAPGGRPAAGRWRAAAAGLAGAFLVAYVVLWAGYGFRYSAVTDPGYRLEWEMLDKVHGPMASAIAWAKDAEVLPEAWLFGLAYARGGASARLAFLNGEQSVTGWWYYFPEAFLLKTPPAFVLLLLWVLLAGIARTRGRSVDGWLLAIPPVLYLAASMAGNLNIGYRHLLPVVPFLFVAAGGTAGLLEGTRVRRAAATTLLAGCALSFGLATPRYLSYFNAFAGGARGGFRYLVDSNIDWGQDLPALEAWLDAHGHESVDLAYFGTADPKAYGIRYRKVVRVHDFEPTEPSVRPGRGDLFAVSVTLLEGVYLDADHEVAQEALRRGLVAERRIEDWIALRDGRVARGERFPPLADWLLASGGISPGQRTEIEAGLLTTWMSRLRDTLTPVGRAGDSILIYRIP
ncbi:MAG: glycosyltransferase family 39 protein [Acidobacteriia bacterium]|nr:glycosyltransferase family 39 protein [Terriglobia bacterium]